MVLEVWYNQFRVCMRAAVLNRREWDRSGIEHVCGKFKPTELWFADLLTETGIFDCSLNADKFGHYDILARRVSDNVKMYIEYEHSQKQMFGIKDLKSRWNHFNILIRKMKTYHTSDIFAKTISLDDGIVFVCLDLSLLNWHKMQYRQHNRETCVSASGNGTIKTCEQFFPVSWESVEHNGIMTDDIREVSDFIDFTADSIDVRRRLKKKKMKDVV
jgi:hypothetical protein